MSDLSESQKPAKGAETPTIIIRFNPTFGGGRVVVSRLQGPGNETEIENRLSGGFPNTKLPDISETIRGEIAEGRRRFVIDLEQAQWLDSKALGYVIQLWTTISGAGGVPVVIHVSDRLRDLFEITRLNDIFMFGDSLEDAQQYLSEQAPDGS